MSHYHCEVILPPGTADIKQAIEQVLAPFDESREDARHGFYDFYVIGGRWSGNHILARLDQKKLEAFNRTLTEMKVTVSGVQSGKQTLQPRSQIPIVDKLWRETFHESGLEQCPLFDHFPVAKHDVCDLGLLSDTMECDRLIIAGPAFESPELKADFMIETGFYNGVTWRETSWDGTLGAAKALYLKDREIYIEAYKRPLSDKHIAVTVDYHS